MNELTKELAEQAGLLGPTSRVGNAHEAAERFAELVRQDEREQIAHTYLKLTLDAVLREREACAKLCDEYLLLGNKIAKAIRARGEQPTISNAGAESNIPAFTLTLKGSGKVTLPRPESKSC